MKNGQDRIAEIIFKRGGKEKRYCVNIPWSSIVELKNRLKNRLRKRRALARQKRKKVDKALNDFFGDIDEPPKK